MAYLLDINVLIALAWPNHAHHREAMQWFKAARRDDHWWATCPLTQSAFVRISSNHRIIPEARSPRAAMEALEKIVALPGHFFLSDDVSILSATEFSRSHIVGHNQINDAHLLALAVRHGICLATFDRGIRELMPPGQEGKHIFLIEPQQ